MKRLMWAGVVLAGLLSGATAADKPAAKHAGFEKLKGLVGEWVAVGPDGKPTDQVVSVYKLTAGGSTVHETIFPGGPNEMVSVYHLDGADLVMTHFCMLGNQPRLKADPASPAGELRFKFTGGSNLDPAKDMHMHEGTVVFRGDDKVEWNWVGYKDGQPQSDHKVAMTLVRKKK